MWPTSELRWLQDRIKGGIGETICKIHFEALGYQVEPIGVEQTAPRYSGLAHDAVPDAYLRPWKDHLQKSPDFVISRIYKTTIQNTEQSISGKKVAVLVDAKFSTTVNFSSTNEAKEKLKTSYKSYKHLIDVDVPVLVYVVDSKKSLNGYLQLAYFNKNLFSNKEFFTNGWWSIGQRGFTNLALYRGNEEDENFFAAYTSIIEPILDNILSS